MTPRCVDCKTGFHKGMRPHAPSNRLRSTTGPGVPTHPDSPTVAAIRARLQRDEPAPVPLTTRRVSASMSARRLPARDWTDALDDMAHPPTPGQVQDLCDQLLKAGRGDLVKAGRALVTWLLDRGDRTLKDAAVQDMLRDVFIAVLRNPRSQEGNWIGPLSYVEPMLRPTRWPAALMFVNDLLLLSPGGAPMVMNQVLRAAKRLPDDLVEPLLNQIVGRPERYLDEDTVRHSLLPVIRTLVGTATHRLEQALQPAPLCAAFGLERQGRCEGEGGTLDGQTAHQLLRSWGEGTTTNLDFRKPLIQTVLEDGLALSVQRRQALVSALLGAHPGPRLIEAPLLELTRSVLAGLGARERPVWPQVRAVLAGLLPPMTVDNGDGWGFEGALQRFPLDVLLAVPKSVQPLAHAWLSMSLVIVESTVFQRRPREDLGCQRWLIKHEAEMDDALLTWAMLGIEVGLGWAASRRAFGAHRLSQWPAVIAEYAPEPAVAERLQRCREQATRLVSRPLELLACPGLSEGDRLRLLEISLLPPGIGPLEQADDAVMSVSAYWALGLYRAPLLVLGSLDRQASLSVEAFARVHEALLDRTLPVAAPSQGDKKPASGATGRDSLDPMTDDSELMAQALGPWRIDGASKGFTQPVADLWAFLQNHQETSGLFYLFGHRPQDLRSDYIAAHRPRIEHALQQMDVARRQVRKRFPQGSEQARLLLQPLDQFARVLRGGLRRIGAEPAQAESRRRTDGKRSEGAAHGPDPDKPATL